MSGLLKIPNRIGNKRPIREILTAGDIDLIPAVKKPKICDIDEEIITDAASHAEIKSEDTRDREENIKKVFAVFVCGPDPTQCVEDPSAPNQRGQTYIDLLKKEDEDEEWKEFMIYRDEFPSKAQISSFSGIILTGSKHDAFTNDAEWKLKLQAIILDIYENRPMIKLLGVCFGHQIIVHSLRYSEDAFVGRNEARTKMEIGLVSVDLTDNFHTFWSRFDIKVNAKTLRIHEAHQDVVFKIPSHLKDANIMAHSENTDIEMYHIGNNIIGIQGHPEFTTSYLTNAIERNTKYMLNIYTHQELKDIKQTMKDCEANREEWKYVFGTWIRF